MSKILGSLTNFSGGIADSNKEGQKHSFSFGRSIDFRTDASQITLLPKTEKESSDIFQSLPKWAERVGTDTYIYDDLGNLYKRTSTPAYTNEHLAPSSHGNGLCYFGEDRYLYYTQDKTFGRWGPSDSSTANWYDDFLGSEGGVPTNTHSAVLELDSSQYFYRADTASLSITGDLSIEAYTKHESLPASGDKMTYVAKWDEDAKRSYWFGIRGISNFFGDGSDGAYTVAADATRTEVDSGCSGTIDTYTLTATNTSFAAGQEILIIQMMGINAGIWQRTKIAAYTAGTITTTDKLKITYESDATDPATEAVNRKKAQVIKIPQYTNVTINAGITLTIKKWTGTVGGIFVFLANGTVTVNGSITAKGRGFNLGGQAGVDPLAIVGTSGEGTMGYITGSYLPYVTVSGVNYPTNGGSCGNDYEKHGGSGGGNGTAGGNSAGGSYILSYGGAAMGSTDLTTAMMGGQGGGTGGVIAAGGGGTGGAGGGIVFPWGATFTMGTNGTIVLGGDNGTAGESGGGGGAAGSCLIKCQTGTLGTNKITAAAGAGSDNNDANGLSMGKDGGVGRICIVYSDSYTGTTNPTLTAIQDSLLGNTEGWELRFGVSSDGADSEFYTHDITSIIQLEVWARWAVTWDASASTANFYKNGTLLATKTGALTSIHDNASQFFVGADKDSGGTVQNYYDGKIDDVRVWNDVRTATELVRYNDFILTGAEPNLIAYYKFDNASTDSQTDGLNDLTGSGTPTYDATDPAFSGLTSRTDLDQSLDTSGNTYTLATAIDEGATHRQTFIPAKDPQESIQVNVAAKGTGDWTLTVHDALNRTIATKTITNAELVTAVDNEFVFSSVWRPVIGATYHFHLTSTVADGTVTTTDNADLETADFHTYYQFLVEDADFHPIIQHLNFLCIGNERYLATYNGVTYTPHKLTLPSGYKIRCFGYWREYLAIGTWRGATITSYDTGCIFFWDGYSDTYNFFIDVPEGGINALFGTKGLLYVWAGYQGDMLMYAGGDSAQKIKKIPKVDTTKYVEIFPGAVDMWRSMIHFGVAGNSDSVVIEKGVYSYGSLNRNYAESLGYDFPLSTGIRTGTTIKVGMIKSIGQTLLIGWKSGSACGIDKVDITGNPYSSGIYESLLTDLGTISKDKYPLTLHISFEALESGESVIGKYKANRSTVIHEQTEDSEGAKELRLTVHEQVKEILISSELKTTGTTSPIVTGISLETEKGERERLA